MYNPTGLIFGYLIVILIVHCIFGAIANAIADKKGRKGFAWGFFLGIIGIIVVALMEPEVQKVAIEEPRANKYEELEKAAELKEKGILTEEEFQVEKEKILNDVEMESETESESAKDINVDEEMKKLDYMFKNGAISLKEYKKRQEELRGVKIK